MRMFKRLLEIFRRERSIHQASLLFEFGPRDKVAFTSVWHYVQDEDPQAVILALFFYARILYELAERNKAQVARELISYLDHVSRRILNAGGGPGRLRLHLGDLMVVTELDAAAERRYQVEFYKLPDGRYRLDFQGSLGKESFYLPAIFLVFLSSCLERLGDAPIKKLAQGISRLHGYYRYRRDFWEGSALTAGPLFALGTEKLEPEEAPSEPCEG